MSKDLDKNFSVHYLLTLESSVTRLEVENIIEKCLFPFPHLWASVSVSIDVL